MASETLQYDPHLPTAIWRDGKWVASTNCETGGTMEEREALAKELVAAYNTRKPQAALVAALKAIRDNGMDAGQCRITAANALRDAGQQSQNGGTE